MKTIPLTQGREAIVDAADYGRLSKVKWFFRAGYAARNRPKGETGPSTIFMHHEVLPRLPGMRTDHKNGDSLDNRRENLRHCTCHQNQFNMKKPKRNTSGIKGVTWDKQHGRWMAQISVNRKHIFLGYFDDLGAAGEARRIGAERLHGEFACVDHSVALARVG